MNNRFSVKYLVIILIVFFGCKQNKTKDEKVEIETPNGMVWISGSAFQRGALENDLFARQDEKPKHTVKVDGFWIDITEVTNAQFKKFVSETGYITVAESEINWDEIKKQLPAETVKPHDSVLQPGSLSFHCKHHEIKNLEDYSQWWEWKIGANWKHPNGKESTIEGKENYPVVHVAYEDALAYCKWANRRLPTEAEWEFAAKGGLDNAIYSWGNDKSVLFESANTWQGEFPNKNTLEDGFERIAPVKSFPKNGYGLYDMLGNVWEWTQDWYDYNYYSKLAESNLTINPLGPEKPYNPNNTYSQEKVIRGGSFLCHDSYCASYRVSARMGSSFDTGLEHLGFRTVATKQMLLNK